MSKVDSLRQSTKSSRKYSEMTIDTRFTRSTYEEVDSSPGKHRRKISVDQLKYAEEHLNREESEMVGPKSTFKLSTEVLSFEMEEQRSHQLKIINSNPQLLAYYNCLKKLFMILYQASIPLNQNKFNINIDTLNNNNLQILSIIFDQQSTEWNLNYIKSLENFADNMLILSNSSQEFERRIELVAIKSCLHNEKRPKIERAFLNTKIEAYWKKIQQKFGDLDVFSYIEDQFQKAEEKLCFIQIQQFVKSKLSTQQFGNMLKKYCQLQEIDHDMNLSFKFQFFMAEELCFNTLNDIFKEDKDESSGICEIM